MCLDFRLVVGCFTNPPLAPPRSTRPRPPVPAASPASHRIQRPRVPGRLHHLPPSYSDCASYAVPAHLLRPSSDHLLTCRLGSGKVSDVFEAEEVRTGARTVFKCLKPVQERKVRRELLVLSHLAPAAGDGRYPPRARGGGGGLPAHGSARPLVLPREREVEGAGPHHLSGRCGTSRIGCWGRSMGSTRTE